LTGQIVQALESFGHQSGLRDAPILL